MAVVVPHRAIDIIANAQDPKQAILDTVGDLSGFEIFGDRILMGIYVRPEKTKGGIIRPDSNKEEDIWQGKVGLILKLGPDAFKNTETGEYYEQRCAVGDWVLYDVQDTRYVMVNDFPCRRIRDTAIWARITDPLKPDSIL